MKYRDVLSTIMAKYTIYHTDAFCEYDIKMTNVLWPNTEMYSSHISAK